jgi:hypothetical protein
MSTALMRLSQAPTPSRKLVPELSPVWEAVILRCLEREPAKRFAGAQDVAAALIADAPREHTATLSGGGAIPNDALGIEEQTRVLESAAPRSATPSLWSRRKNSIRAACLLILSVIVLLASAKHQRSRIRPADRIPSVVEKESGQSGNIAEDVRKSKQETSSDPRKNRVAQDVRESTRAVKEAKKEVSADPREELANMGIQWNLDSFKSSTRSGDIRALELFLKGGFSANQLDEDGTMFVLTQAVYGNVPNFAQVLDLFQKNGLNFHAVETGNENQLFQFRHPNHTLEFEAYDAAAFKRNVSIVQILHQAGANSDSIIADYKSHLLADTNAIKAAMNHPESNDFGALRMNLMGYAAKLDVILTALGIPVDTVIPANPAPMP